MTDKKQAVYELQQFLRNISRAFGEIPLVIPDGNFSEDTKKALEEFQKNEGLPVTGSADYETWERLRTQNALAVFEASEPRQVVNIKSSDLPLSYGSENIFVQTLKNMFSGISGRFTQFIPLEATPLFDEATRENVTRWQGIAFLPQTGEVDKRTWNSIADYYIFNE